MTEKDMKLEDWLDDLCVRFIVNLPTEELELVERICFQIEEAQWFYEDFIRPLDPRLPSLSLRAFSFKMFQQCPLMAHWSRSQVELAFDQFLAYKTRVPVRGAILVNDDMDQVVLVKGWKKSSSWTFPRGKINKDEPDLDCAVREVYEETGFDVKESGLVEADTQKDFIELPMREQSMRLYVIWGVSMDTDFAPRTRKEISGIEWYKLSELPTGRKSKVARPDQQNNHAPGKLPPNRFYMVAPFLSALKRKIRTRKKQMYKQGKWAPPAVDAETMVEEEEDALQNQRRRFVAKTPALSDLHEVNTPEDAMAQLKSVLKISTPAPAEQQQPKPELDRSQTLLGILRSASASEATPTPAPPSQPLAATAVPQQPMQQAASTVPPLQGPLPQPTYPGMPTPSYPPYGAPVPAHAPPPVPGVMPMPPYGPGAAPLPTQPHPSYPGPAPQFWQGQQMPYPGPAYPSFPPQPFPPIPPYTAPFPAPAHVAPPAPPQTAGVPPSGPVPQQFPPPPPPQTGASTPGPASLPYQRTGDPEFVLTQQQRGESGFAPAVPAASSLPPPKLTSHSLSLLNVLKGESPKPAAAQPVATVPAAQTAASATVPNQSASSLLDLLKKHPQSAKPQPGPPTATATATAVATPSGAAAVEAHPEPGAQVSQVRLDGPTRASPAPSRRHQPRPPTSDGERPESAHRSTPRSQRAPPTAPKGMTGYQGRARWVQEVDKRQSSLSPPKQKITILPRPQQPQRQLQEQNHARSGTAPSRPHRPTPTPRHPSQQQQQPFQPPKILKRPDSDFEANLPSETVTVSSFGKPAQAGRPAVEAEPVRPNEQTRPIQRQRLPLPVPTDKVDKPPRILKREDAVPRIAQGEGEGKADQKELLLGLFGKAQGEQQQQQQRPRLDEEAPSSGTASPAGDNKAFLLGYLEGVAKKKR